MRRVGYAGICEGLRKEHGGPGYVPAASRRGLNQSLRNIEQILRYNHRHGIRMYRMSSAIAPSITHPERPERHGQIDAARDELRRVGALARAWDIRLSFHPDQFVVLNSPSDGVVERSVAELAWQAEVLDAMGQPPGAKLVVHAGGVYGDKDRAAARFVEAYRRLPAAVRRRLVLENDEWSYDVWDVLAISRAAGGIPVVYDQFHHVTYGAPPGEGPAAPLAAAAATWGAADGAPKIHYSSPEPGGRRGQHGYWIDLGAFEAFYRSTRHLDYDIMIEARSKDLSALAVMEVIRRVDGEPGSEPAPRATG